MLAIALPPRKSLCLRCSDDVDDDAVPYYKTLYEHGFQYVLCWDCMPSEEQSEVIEWEGTVPWGGSAPELANERGALSDRSVASSAVTADATDTGPVVCHRGGRGCCGERYRAIEVAKVGTRSNLGVPRAFSEHQGQ
jgi:hypothetical protein